MTTVVVTGARYGYNGERRQWWFECGPCGIPKEWTTIVAADPEDPGAEIRDYVNMYHAHTYQDGAGRIKNTEGGSMDKVVIGAVTQLGDVMAGAGAGRKEGPKPQSPSGASYTRMDFVRRLGLKGEFEALSQLEDAILSSEKGLADLRLRVNVAEWDLEVGEAKLVGEVEGKNAEERKAALTLLKDQQLQGLMDDLRNLRKGLAEAEASQGRLLRQHRARSLRIGSINATLRYLGDGSDGANKEGE